MDKYGASRRSAVGATVAAMLMSAWLPAVAADAPTEGEQVWPYLAGLPKDQRRAVLEKEAAREGTLTLYGQLGIDRAKILIDVFNARYPKIKVNYVRQTATEQGDKLLLEHRANRVGGDAIISDTSRILVLKEVLAPYEPTSWPDFDARFLFGSGAQGWTAVAYEVLPSTIAWRTDRVNSAEAPKTLDQVADPRWKGRVGTTTHLETFMVSMSEVYGEKVAMEKVRRLAQVDAKLYRSQAALGEALSTGTVDIAWNLPTTRADQMKSRGQPVDYVLQEPSFGIAVTVSALKRAKNPYAGALFFDYLLDADTLQKNEVAEGLKGRLFGNKKGKFGYDLSQFATTKMYPPIEEAKFKELNIQAEKWFFRKEY